MFDTWWHTTLRDGARRCGTSATASLAATASPGDEAWTELRALSGQQRRRLLGAGSELDLHPAQAGALLQLSSPPLMTEFAAILACDNSNVTGLVDRLEARASWPATPIPRTPASSTSCSPTRELAWARSCWNA